MLVLLVIFYDNCPLCLLEGVDVELPTASASPIQDSENER